MARLSIALPACGLLPTSCPPLTELGHGHLGGAVPFFGHRNLQRNRPTPRLLPAPANTNDRLRP